MGFTDDYLKPIAAGAAIVGATAGSTVGIYSGMSDLAALPSVPEGKTVQETAPAREQRATAERMANLKVVGGSIGLAATLTGSALATSAALRRQTRSEDELMEKTYGAKLRADAKSAPAQDGPARNWADTVRPQGTAETVPADNFTSLLPPEPSTHTSHAPQQQNPRLLLPPPGSTAAEALALRRRQSEGQEKQ